jgi:hypothetical protein
VTHHQILICCMTAVGDAYSLFWFLPMQEQNKASSKEFEKELILWNWDQTLCLCQGWNFR